MSQRFKFTFSTGSDIYKEKMDKLSESSKYLKEWKETSGKLKEANEAIPLLTDKLNKLQNIIHAENDLNSRKVTYELALADDEGNMYSEKYRAEILKDGPGLIKAAESKLKGLI